MHHPCPALLSLAAHAQPPTDNARDLIRRMAYDPRSDGHPRRRTRRLRPLPPEPPTLAQLQVLASTVSGAESLLSKADDILSSVESDLEDAQKFSSRFGETCTAVPIKSGNISRISPALTSTALSLTSAAGQSDATPIAANETTGGYSNIDHIVVRTGCYRRDRIAEIKRQYKRRAKAMVPESRGEDRWDRTERIPGSRRRRILRDKDRPSAPPEPPPTGYIVFVGQMTTKIRHDRPDVRHNQIRVIGEISKIWSQSMSEAEREHYETFAKEAQEEYGRLYGEYRATGSYRGEESGFLRLGSDTAEGDTARDGGNVGTISRREGSTSNRGPWVRADSSRRNALEREISNYDSVIFPPRPANLDPPLASNVGSNHGTKRQIY